MARKRARAGSPAAVADGDAAAAAAPPAEAVELSARVRAVHARVADFAFDAPTGSVGDAPPSVSFVQRYRAEFGVATPARAACHVAEYLRFMAIKAALLELQMEQEEEEEAAAAQQAGEKHAAAAPAAASAAAAAASASAPAPSGATPSLAVDAVWHTHLFYTRSYARFCAAL